MNKKPLSEMTASELEDLLTEIRELNPHSYERLQSYRIARKLLESKRQR